MSEQPSLVSTQQQRLYWPDRPHCRSIVQSNGLLQIVFRRIQLYSLAKDYLINTVQVYKKCNYEEEVWIWWMIWGDLGEGPEYDQNILYGYIQDKCRLI